MSHRMSLMPGVPSMETKRDTPTEFEGFPSELHDVVRFIGDALLNGDAADGRRCERVYYTVVPAAVEDETQYIVVGTLAESVGPSLAFFTKMLEGAPLDTEKFNAVRQVRFVASDHVQDRYSLQLDSAVKGCVVIELTANPRLLATPPNYAARPTVSVCSGLVSKDSVDVLVQMSGNDEKDREDLRHVFDVIYTLFSLEVDVKAQPSSAHFMLNVALAAPFVNVMQAMQLVELSRTGSWHPVVPGGVFPAFVSGDSVALCINVLRRKNTTASVVQREPYAPDRSGLRSYGKSARVTYVEHNTDRKRGKKSLF